MFVCFKDSVSKCFNHSQTFCDSKRNINLERQIKDANERILRRNLLSMKEPYSPKLIFFISVSFVHWMLFKSKHVESFSLPSPPKRTISIKESREMASPLFSCVYCIPAHGRFPSLTLPFREILQALPGSFMVLGTKLGWRVTSRALITMAILWQ